jgi:hypothetical protein
LLIVLANSAGVTPAVCFAVPGTALFEVFEGFELPKGASLQVSDKSAANLSNDKSAIARWQCDFCILPFRIAMRMCYFRNKCK